MTWAYVSNNPCTLAVDYAWGGTYLEGNRKGLYTEIFFMFMVYFLSQVLHAFRYKNSAANRSSVQHALIPARISEMNEQGNSKAMHKIDQEKIEGKDERPDLPWHEKRWNRNFSYMFSSHAVGLAMVILFSPLAGALVVAYLHLLLFFVYCLCEFKKLIMGAKIMRVLCDATNLVLMIIGTAGINYAQFCKDAYGFEVCCRSL